MQQTDIDHYCTRTEQNLQTVHVPTEAALCRNANCKLESHINDLCKLYDNVVETLILAGAPLESH